MSLRLVEQHFDSFFEVPFKVYPKESPYVSPMRSDLARFLDEKKNPLFKYSGQRTYYTALRDGNPVGRVTAHIHKPSNELYGLKRGYFGYFDCADDVEAARALLGAAEAWCRGQGCAEIVGPFNLTAMQQMGAATGGFDRRPYTDMAFNPAHIPVLLEACGYSPSFPMTTFEIDVSGVDRSVLLGERERRLLDDPRVTLADVSRRHFRKEMLAACAILNNAFATNPMFVPLSEEEFLFQAEEMLMIIDPRITCVARLDGEPVGVMVLIPDLNPLLRALGSRMGPSLLWRYPLFRLKRDRALLVFGALKKAHQAQGFSSAMMHRVFESLQRTGYKTLGVTWVWDGNAGSLRQMEKMGAKPLHRLHLFSKELSAGLA